MSVLRTKSIEQSIADTEEPEHRLKQDLGALATPMPKAQSEREIGR